MTLNPREFAEERSFFRSLGWDDRRIAARLDIGWEAYRRRFLRHPELGPIHDPVERERQDQIDLRNSLRPQSEGKRSA